MEIFKILNFLNIFFTEDEYTCVDMRLNVIIRTGLVLHVIMLGHLCLFSYWKGSLVYRPTY